MTVDQRPGGRNNRLYRVATSDGMAFALKAYPVRQGDARDRLGTEFAALEFLGRYGLTEIPRALAADRRKGFALYEWIEGEPVSLPQASDIDAALLFAERLRALSRQEDARNLPLAAEACLAAIDIVTQIDSRLRRLMQVAATESELDRFLKDDFGAVYPVALDRARSGYAAANWRFDLPLADHQRSLSPSDFGFHNAIRRKDGRVVFVDFEYFGWDDPVRLVADFVQHPGMNLSQSLAAQFYSGSLKLFGDDAGFAPRLALLKPLIGLRWCMILLNEFLPERWAGRVLSGMKIDQTTAKRRQLDKARARLATIRDDITA